MEYEVEMKITLKLDKEEKSILQKASHLLSDIACAFEAEEVEDVIVIVHDLPQKLHRDDIMDMSSNLEIIINNT
jgi:hypothetical protein